MSLDYNYKEVKDWEIVCEKSNGLGGGLGEKILDVLTEAIIWSTVTIGLNEITKDNYKEFHERIIAMEIAAESYYLLYSVKAGTRRNPSLKEIEMHIGLTTNATPMKTGAFYVHIKNKVKARAKAATKLQEDAQNQKTKA